MTGGFSLAARWAGIETVAFCEIDPFCRKVLGKNFPGVPIFSDIKELRNDGTMGTVDIISGGVPCQPASVAGKRGGSADDRWLWPETYRVIKEFNPAWVLLENVPGLLSLGGGMVFESLLSQLESEGYEVITLNIPACGVGAPHRRERVWIIAAYVGNRRQQMGSRLLGRQAGQESLSATQAFTEWTIESSVVRGINGVSPKLDGDLKIPNRIQRVSALGNSIIPHIAFQIFRAIIKTEERINGKLQ